MTHDPENLDVMFAQARKAEPAPDLIARVLRDAEAVQAPDPSLSRDRAAPPRAAWWAKALSALGGWGAVSGITAGGGMGLAVGLYAPDTVATLTGSGSLTDYGLAPDMDGLWWEDGDV